MRALVSAKTSYGTASAASLPTAKPVAASPPGNTVAPSITVGSSPQRGQTASATPGVWSGLGNGYAYQWQHSSDGGTSWQNIAGATSTSYLLAKADVGTMVRVQVTATNPDGTVQAASSASATVAAAPVVNVTAPSVSVSQPAGASGLRRTYTLSASPGTFSGVVNASAYQWQRSVPDSNTWQNIAGATGLSYTVAQADEGDLMRFQVTATNPDNTLSLSAGPSLVVSLWPPSNTVAPAVSGTATRLNTLTVTPGLWTGPGLTYTYQWRRDGGHGPVAIPGATGTGYALTQADEGAYISVLVTATNLDGSVQQLSNVSAAVKATPPANTALPAVAGAATARQGTLLSASPVRGPRRTSPSPTNGRPAPRPLATPTSRAPPPRPTRLRRPT